MSDDFYCKICSIACTGKAPYEQHVVSVKHIRKASVYESQTSSEQSISSNTSTASLTITTRTPPPSPNTRAPFTTTSDTILEDSPVLSTFVPISAETMRILLEWNHPLDYKPYCDICQLPLHGENNAGIHFNSNNNIHTQKLAAWKQIRENDARYSCKVCSEIFANENQMREHFSSDSHANTIEQKVYLEKFIQIYQTYNRLKQARKDAIDANNAADNNFDNQFQKLNIIDATEEPESPLPNRWPINSARLQQAMRNILDDDDD